MAIFDEYNMKHHHGETLGREWLIRFVDGPVVEFSVDPYKIYWWDLLEDMKELGYSVKNDVNRFFYGRRGNIKLISNDKDIISLANYLRKYRTTDVSAKLLGIKHDMINKTLVE